MNKPKKKNIRRLINTNEAIEILSKRGIHISEPTMRKWVREFKLGKQFGGKRSTWYIYPERLERFLRDDSSLKKNENKTIKINKKHKKSDEGKEPTRTN